MLRLLLLLIIVTPAVCQDLPQDPLQRCATKAINGDFGKLKDWQAKGYKLAIKHGVTVQGKAWVTSYFPSEGFREGDCTASGRGVSIRSAAVKINDFKKLKLMYVWTNYYGIRIVEDCGANSNLRKAQSQYKKDHPIQSAKIWLDYWFPHRRGDNPVTPYAFIPSK